MAKAKAKPVEPIEEEVVVEEVKEKHPTFVERKLKAINAMENPAKAQALASRLLRKAR